MKMIIHDPVLEARIIRDRQERRIDRHDEVWEGVYVMSPLANNEHQQIVSSFDRCFGAVIVDPALGIVQPGANVSELAEGWGKNYRCPDVVVYLNTTSAIDHNTHWQGGPDFGVEIVSLYDKSREKFDFYAKVNTQELLLVDRYPWSLELYRLNAAGSFDLVGRSTLDQPDILESRVMPLAFHLADGAKRPTIVIRHLNSDQTWSA